MCADLLGGAFHRREFLDLRELNNLLEASAGAVGNLDVAAGALDDLARDGEPKAGAGDILPPAWIDAEERLEHLAEKLRRAGADRIVQPYSTAGKEMATLVLRPQVAAFLEVVSVTGGADLQYEEIIVTEASGQSGKTIRELRIRHETGAVIVALRKEDGTFDTTPDPDAVLDSGDVMIAAGSSDELRLLEELFAPREPVAR